MVAGFEGVVGFVVGDGVVGITHGVPGTSHWPAESEQLSTWPFGERQSLFCELSQVPGKRYRRMKATFLGSYKN